MKNQNSKSKVTKRKLSKCKDVCRTYTDIQYAYCDYLQADNSIAEFQCNVILTDFSIEGVYSTDFVCTKTNGDMKNHDIHENKNVCPEFNGEKMHEQ